MTYSHSEPADGSGARALGASEVLDLLPSLRSLARGLVRDDAEAEDLAQEALHTASSGGRSVRDVRKFAAGVLRKKALQRRRAEARRLHHEGVRAAAAGEADHASPDRITERVEVMGIVLDEIQSLPAAQGRAIGLRYVDELAVADIAEREGSTPSTVRSHLSRGLQTLRERLDARFDGRAAWSSVLAPWALDPVSLEGDAAGGVDGSSLDLPARHAARGAARASASAAGGALVTMTALKTTFLVGTLAAAGTWISLLRTSDDVANPGDTTEDGARIERTSEADGATAPDAVASLTNDASGGARSAAVAGTGPAAHAAATVATFPVEGRIVDARTGLGVPGVSVQVFPNDPELRGSSWRVDTDEEGRFRPEGATLPATEVTVLLLDTISGRIPTFDEGAIAFPFESDIAIETEPTIRFALEGAPLPEDAVVYVRPGPSSMMYSTLQPGRLPWMRFHEPLSSSIETFRLSVDDGYLFGVAAVPEGEGRFDEPLPVTLRPGGSIELVTERTELRGQHAVTIVREGETSARPRRLPFERSDDAPEEVVAKTGPLAPGAYLWTATVGDVELDGRVVVRPMETERVELEGLRWEERSATVLIDASALSEPDPGTWQVRAIDEAQVDRTLEARVERVGAPGAGTWHAVVDDLPPGSWQLAMMVPKSERIDPPLVRLVAGEVAGPIVVTPASSRTVEVRVVDDATGDPIRDAQVWTFRGLEGDTLSGGRKGVFADTELSANEPTSLFARVEGYRLQQIDFNPATSSDVVEFRMVKGWAGRVMVFDMSTQAFATDIPVDVDGQRRGTTDQKGSLWFEGDGPPSLVEVAAGLDDVEVVFDPFTSGVADSTSTPGYIFAIRRR
ncbi:MAG: RNA polymerase sigma factor [Planctomycetota bacterium]